MLGDGRRKGTALCDVDDTVEVDDEAAAVETSHRNYDAFMESTPEGTHFLASCKHVPSRGKACRTSYKTQLHMEKHERRRL